MKIYIDADACPVKDIVISLAEEYALSVVLVKSYAHYSNQDYPHHVETVYVDTGAEMADYRIMQLTSKEDIVITQDYGLASLALAKGCTVVHHKGFIYSNKNIDHLLQTRYMSAMARKAGKNTKGPKAFTQKDKYLFFDCFKKVLHERAH